MNLTNLETFRVVSSCMSFTSAAEKLNMSQPGVSRQISALEAELGTELFDRNGRLLSLTPAGQVLADDLPEEMDRIRAVLKNVVKAGKGQLVRLRIGILNDQTIPPSVSEQLRQLRREQVDIVIRSYGFQGLDTALRTNAIDAALSVDLAGSAFLDMDSLLIDTEPMCLAFRQEYLAEFQETGNIFDAVSARMPILIPSLESFYRRQQGALNQARGNFEGLVQEADPETILPMVNSGLAAAVTNATGLISCCQGISLFPLSPVQVEKRLYFPAGTAVPALKCLCERLQKHVVRQTV